MRNRLIIDGNAVYELDEECLLKKQLFEEDTGTAGEQLKKENQNQGQKRRAKKD
ncbi:MAG: hypothetical protein PHN80_01820 [Hespellia sp.]|nr:hypothetical protein [Hespellia sp.]